MHVYIYQRLWLDNTLGNKSCGAAVTVQALVMEVQDLLAAPSDLPHRRRNTEMEKPSNSSWSVSGGDGGRRAGHVRKGNMFIAIVICSLAALFSVQKGDLLPSPARGEPPSLVQRCLHRVRKSNKVVVPNADFTMPPFQPLSSLKPRRENSAVWMEVSCSSVAR